MGIGTLLLNAVLGGVAAVVLITKFLYEAATRAAVVGGGPEVFQALGTSWGTSLLVPMAELTWR